MGQAGSVDSPTDESTCDPLAHDYAPTPRAPTHHQRQETRSAKRATTSVDRLRTADATHAHAHPTASSLQPVSSSRPDGGRAAPPQVFAHPSQQQQQATSRAQTSATSSSSLAPSLPHASAHTHTSASMLPVAVSTHARIPPATHSDHTLAYLTSLLAQAEAAPESTPFVLHGLRTQLRSLQQERQKQQQQQCASPLSPSAGDQTSVHLPPLTLHQSKKLRTDEQSHIEYPAPYAIDAAAYPPTAWQVNFQSGVAPFDLPLNASPIGDALNFAQPGAFVDPSAALLYGEREEYDLDELAPWSPVPEPPAVETPPDTVVEVTPPRNERMTSDATLPGADAGLVSTVSTPSSVSSGSGHSSSSGVGSARSYTSTSLSTQGPIVSDYQGVSKVFLANYLSADVLSILEREYGAGNFSAAAVRQHFMWMTSTLEPDDQAEFLSQFAKISLKGSHLTDGDCDRDGDKLNCSRDCNGAPVDHPALRAAGLPPAAADSCFVESVPGPILSPGAQPHASSHGSSMHEAAKAIMRSFGKDLSPQEAAQDDLDGVARARITILFSVPPATAAVVSAAHKRKKLASSNSAADESALAAMPASPMLSPQFVPASAVTAAAPPPASMVAPAEPVPAAAPGTLTTPPEFKMHRMVQVNRAFERLSGYTQAEMVSLIRHVDHKLMFRASAQTGRQRGGQDQRMSEHRPS